MHIVIQIMNKMLKNAKLAAFGLIEAAILLVILGIVSSAGIKTYNHLRIQQKVRRTHEHRDQIISALAAFVARNGRLPCPSKPETEGIEARNGQHGCILPLGHVPYRTIMLPNAYAFDGDQKPLLYAPEPQLVTQYADLPPASNFNDSPASEDTLESFAQAQWEVGSIRVTDSNGLSVLPEKNNLIAFVIMTNISLLLDHRLDFQLNDTLKSELFWVSRDQFLSHELDYKKFKKR